MKKIVCIAIALMCCACASNAPIESDQPTQKPSETINEPKMVYQDVTPIEQGNDWIIPFNTTISLETLTQEDGDVLYDEFNDAMHHYAQLFDAHHHYTDDNGNPIINVAYINDVLEYEQEVMLDKDLFDLLMLSQQMMELTDNRFNPTLYDLTQLWGPLFSPFPMQQDDPDSSLIQAALANRITADQFFNAYELNQETQTLIKHEVEGKHVKLDLGGIAKGYALDCVTQQLNRHELPFLLNAGTSSISAYTPKGVNKTWYIGIRDPFARVSLLYDVGLTENACFTTSGDDSQYFLLTQGNETVIRHHILDGNSGYSNNYIRSATVLSSPSSNGIADALSTALFNCSTNQERIDMVTKIKDAFDIDIEFATLENTNSESGYLDITTGFSDALIDGTQSSHVIETRIIE